MKNILFVPALKQGSGLGHFKRVEYWAKQFAAGHVQIYLDPLDSLRYKNKINTRDLSMDLITELKPELYDYIIIDYRHCPLTLWNILRIKPCVVIDEGNVTVRDSADYVIDTLQGPASRQLVNYFQTGFLKLPKPKKEKRKKMLISFGGEDPAKLSETLLNFLEKTHPEYLNECTIVKGPLFAQQDWPENLCVLDSPEDLSEILPDYEYVVCSFGLTAYEAASAGANVAVLNPTSYHESLTRLAGFFSLGVCSVSFAKWKIFQKKTADLKKIEEHSFSQFIGSLDIHNTQCPFCKSFERSALDRQKYRSFFRCSGCSLVYEVLHHRSRQSYDENYFFLEYQQQYGKTYLEDFEHIQQAGKVRLTNIMKLKKIESLLDIGCAYGAFVAAAKDLGIFCKGLDICEDAVRYVEDKLGIPAAAGDFLSLDHESLRGDQFFDAVTMWFVIEHFQDLEAVFRKVHTLLHKGGILAFSTPNFYGGTGRFMRKKFLRDSPEDHYLLLESHRIRDLLKKSGFELKKMKSTGHHPERWSKPSWLPSWVFLAFSKIMFLGDTFEVYAVKE